MEEELKKELKLQLQQANDLISYETYQSGSVDDPEQRKTHDANIKDYMRIKADTIRQIDDLEHSDFHRKLDVAKVVVGPTVVGTIFTTEMIAELATHGSFTMLRTVGKSILNRIPSWIKL